jgi:hypothetical protein
VIARVPPFLKNNPLIGPQWRADRARDLVSLGTRPDRNDDGYVRSYWDFLKRNKTNKGAAYIKHPQAFVADSIENYRDTEWRDILQAKLLTEEPIEDIADWLGSDPGTVEYFEKVFFNVRHRRHNRGWIMKVIMGTTDDRASNDMCTMTDQQRGIVYRLFAYYGGPEVLEACITGLMPSVLPNAKKDLQKWFDTALEQLIRSRAVQAARVMEINKFNIMPMLELTLTGIRERAEGETGIGAFGEFAEKVTATIGGWSMSEKTFNKRSDQEKKLLTSAVEPRVSELVEALDGEIPQSLEEAERLVDRSRIHVQEEEAAA